MVVWIVVLVVLVYHGVHASQVLLVIDQQTAVPHVAVLFLGHRQLLDRMEALRQVLVDCLDQLLLVGII